MYTCACTALCECGHKERRAGRRFEVEGATEVRLRGEVHHKHVRGVETLFLNTGRGEVDMGGVTDGDTTTSTGYLGE